MMRVYINKVSNYGGGVIDWDFFVWFWFIDVLV